MVLQGSLAVCLSFNSTQSCPEPPGFRLDPSFHCVIASTFEQTPLGTTINEL